MDFMLTIWNRNYETFVFVRHLDCQKKLFKFPSNELVFQTWCSRVIFIMYNCFPWESNTENYHSFNPLTMKFHYFHNPTTMENCTPQSIKNGVRTLSSTHLSNYRRICIRLPLQELQAKPKHKLLILQLFKRNPGGWDFC